MSLSRGKGVFHLRPYWRAARSKTGLYTDSLPLPMFVWHSRSRGSSTRQARCHQQMGCRYVVNISVGSIPSLSIWMSVYPKVYLALLKRLLRTAANFFLNMCMLLFLSVPCKTGWLLSVNVLWFFLVSFLFLLLFLASLCSFSPCYAARPDKLDA